jgi:pimeloyl-ACP methyl ester carboxylesterase
MLRTLLGALAPAMLAGAAVQPPASRIAEAGKVEVGEFKGLYACALDRLLAGPSGEVAIWEGDDRALLGTTIFSPGGVIAGRIGDPGPSGKSHLHLFSALGRALFPIRWAGRDGILYARTRDPESQIVMLRADGGPVTELARLGPAWWPITLNAVGHGGIEALLDPSVEARAKRIDGTTFLRGHATLGAKLELLGARRSDLELVRIGEASLDPVGLNAEYTHHLTVFPDSSRFAAGIAYEGATSTGRLAYLPYQMPLVDQATGRVAGKFGPGGILLEGKRRLSRSLAKFGRLYGESRVVVDASLSGETLMVLTLSGRGNRSIVRIAPDGLSEQPLCTDFFVPDRRSLRSPNPLVSADSFYRPLFRAFALDSQGREVMKAGRPIVTLHRLGDVDARDAVLNIHGGPASSIFPGDHPLLQVGRLLTPGRDIVSIEYSGSIGGGSELTRRLGERGLAALAEDMGAVVRWLDRRKYRRVFIVASSFGGIPALVALDRHRSRFAAAFFFAPVLRWPEPEEHVYKGPFDSAMPDTQLAFERALLGGKAGRARFRDELAALVARAPLGPSDRFYFAERDPASRAADLPAGTAAAHEIVPRTLHMTVFADPEAWGEIERKVR